MDLSVITVTYNNQDSIEGYLDSLKYLPKNSEVIIVDNASSDDTSKLVDNHSDISVKNDTNVGFARASNQGAKKAKGEYLLFLNPDVVMSESIDDLLSFIKSDDDIGLIAPKLINDDGSIQKSARSLPTLSGAISEYILGKKLAYSEFAPLSSEPSQVDCVYGAALLMKKDFFDRMGGFDEKYFLYYEDIDLCKRVNNTGKKIIYFPKIKLIHQKGASKTKVVSLPTLIRTLALFFPIAKNTRDYFQVQSRNKYHGGMISFLIALTLFIGGRSK